jgi:monoamine oxidase
VVHVGSRAGTAARRIAADRVLVTVPVSVLKAPAGSPGAIRFRPALPEKDRALSRLETGEVVKVVFRFRERFWEEEGLLAGRRDRYDFAFLHARDAAVPTWWTSAPAQSPMLTGWVGGPSARALLPERDETVAAVALEALGNVLKVSARRLKSLLEGWHFHNWTKDPFSRGAYSYTGVGGAAAHRALARPVAGTLFFAGEATDSDQSGTVAGAIASGRRAAGEILGK